VVFYEMTTGRPAFPGPASAVIFDAILHHAPISPASIIPETPAELERLISKCLEKDRELRYQSASELRADLKRLQRDTTSGASVVRRGVPLGPRYRRLVPWIAAGALVLVAGALASWGRSKSAAAPEGGPLKISVFTTDGGTKMGPELSPDG